MLIPLYFLIGVWGGEGRLGATLKFVIYTMAGSLLMLAAVIALGLSQGTFDMVAGQSMAARRNDWIFLGFMAAFAVKAPLFPFHGWLPDAYRESPAEVSARALGRRLEGRRVRLPADRDHLLPRARRRTSARRSSCSPRSGSSTARCSRSARPTSAASSRTRASRSCR